MGKPTRSVPTRFSMKRDPVTNNSSLVWAAAIPLSKTVAIKPAITLIELILIVILLSPVAQAVPHRATTTLERPLVCARAPICGTRGDGGTSGALCGQGGF